ncbi:MAG: DUF4202 family protein [archaeon]
MNKKNESYSRAMHEIEQEILDLLKKSPEESKHAKDTLGWLLKINPNPDFIIRVSALGHDIERAMCSKDDKAYISHREFKTAHSKRSAEILKDILLKHKTKTADIQRMQDIILHHEFGGNKEANLIKDADSLANFQWCDDMFGKLETHQLKETMIRMFERMEEENKRFSKKIRFKHAEVKGWLKDIS